MKVYEGIMGLVVGDALGVPFEFKERDTFKCTDMTGYGTHAQPVGTWSDDSSMTLATMYSIKMRSKLNLTDMMHRFYMWLFCGMYTPYGKVFDAGCTTIRAIKKYSYSPGIDPVKCGGDGEMDNGNGSLMRILPLAFIDCTMEDVFNVSALTHAHHISQMACGIYFNIAKHLIKGETKNEAVEAAMEKCIVASAKFERLDFIAELDRDEIRSTGYVVDTLEAALWCFLTTESYRDCVLTAVNLGNDTDTVAAVAGGLAGIYYGIGGETGIPEEWIETIAKKEWIKDLCESFEKKFQHPG
jgi:ADP-ribosylglycohydrolase